MTRSIDYVGSVKKDLQNFPKKPLEKFSQELDMLKEGLDQYVESKSLHGLGHGVRELKLNGRPAYRLVYVIRGNVIHILHAFSKTSTGTDRKHESTIKLRYSNL